MNLMGWFLKNITERPASKYSLAEMTIKMEDSTPLVTERVQKASDTPRNREQIAHIVGIERWSQRRLRVALGEPFLLDEYDGYRPNKDGTMQSLRDAWTETRAETLSIARQLQQANVPPTRVVQHNDVKEMSVRGWLYYLDAHAKRETMLMR